MCSSDLFVSTVICSGGSLAILTDSVANGSPSIVSSMIAVLPFEYDPLDKTSMNVSPQASLNVI